MAWNTGLAGAVLIIAQCDENPLRVMAGPGTGKSFAMKRRVARLLEITGVEPRRILAVTFTRNAAADLLKDLHGLGIPGCDGIRAGTLHSFCYALMGSQHVFDYLGRNARPLITFNKSGVAQFECQPLLEDVGSTLADGGKRTCTKRIRAFEAAWARLQHQIPGWPADRLDQQFHRELINWFMFHKAMLIGELVPETLRYIRNNPRAPVLRYFDHIIVDEYQDLNKAEQVLLDILSSNSKLSIVGDVDQSIYSFRYANPEGINDFIHRHPDTRDEPLQVCQRCPRRVVVLADHLIRHNHPIDVVNRLNPKSDNPDGEIYILQWSSIDSEAQGIATYVQHLICSQRYSPGDIIVLSPRRLLGYGIRNALRTLTIPTHSYYHEEALESIEAQKAFTLLTLLAIPDDRVALRFWLGLESPTWCAGEYNRLRTHCEASGQSPRDLLDQLVSGRLTITRTGNLQRRYRDLLAELLSLEGIGCEAIVGRLFPEDADWAKPIRDLSRNIVNRIETPMELLDELRFHITQPEMPEEGDYVRVMSFHKSKGLTSKVVIVTGCIEGLIPTTDPDHSYVEARANIEEQRRLLYVCLTRCREVLVISSVLRLPADLAYRIGARIRGRSGVCRTIASRFLSELGPTTPNALIGENWFAEEI